ncbi:ABC-2 type transport system ATP-binding protein [Butyrivibrio fibrisolvens DSM 3071]|uniref:ABC-2 type transport system ATP-binding protein n=1 Tax=Butyrivibrio fibrisolvens DSM 3071 TaxID=1121131 RepID=A0A1M5XYU7_BUTFI|nr:ABC transporter ATP-binding protein [Butyrivibrio fibrisolvens]SHI04970.1 ABC-2 type transport system ATP-binding protein [Butyrivibrio fibrisolvens DSM 3071]
MELSVRDITKKYSDKVAVNDVSLNIEKGITGLLGANGAGKTTLMRMIADIIKPDTGNITYDGVPITVLDSEYRNIFGYLPQEFGFYPEFTVIDYLDYMAALKGLTKADSKRKIDSLLEQMTLTDVRRKMIRKLSGGMRRRVGIAQALLNNPEILILDEPTAGLDPGERNKFRQLLSEFSQDRIVLISTHIVSDVEYIATRQVIMKDGKIIRDGSTDTLVKEMDGKVWECTVDNRDIKELEKTLQIINLKNVSSDRTEIRFISDTQTINNASNVSPRLEDLYMWLFGNKEE